MHPYLSMSILTEPHALFSIANNKGEAVRCDKIIMFSITMYFVLSGAENSCIGI